MRCTYCNSTLVEDAAFCPHCNTPVEGVAECTDYQYEAFISYRHLPLDRKAAMKIQRAIESFRIPKQLQDEAGRQKLGKCFRDEDELPTSDSLSAQIENALKHARFLIVVCSPRTRESLWVRREVELYASYHGRSRILIALADGEPDESFPELMRSIARKNDAGEIEDVSAEPLAADFRDLKRSKFNIEKLRVIAPIVGCGFDDLRQRAKQRRNRTIAAIAAGVTAVSVAFGSVSTYQQIQISESYRQIQLEQSEFLATESAELLAHGDRYQATQVALAALPASSLSNDRPFVPAAQMALEQSLGVYPQASDWNSLYSQVNLASQTSPFLTCNEHGLEAIVASDNCIEVRELATGNLVTRFDAESLLEVTTASLGKYLGLEFVGDRLIVVYDGVAGCFDATEGVLVWKMPLEGLSYYDRGLAVSPDGRFAAVSAEGALFANELTIHIIDMRTGAIAQTVELADLQGADESSSLSMRTQMLAYAPDGTHLYVGDWGTLVDIDLASGSWTQRVLRYRRS